MREQGCSRTHYEYARWDRGLLTRAPPRPRLPLPFDTADVDNLLRHHMRAQSISARQLLSALEEEEGDDSDAEAVAAARAEERRPPPADGRGCLNPR